MVSISKEESGALNSLRWFCVLTVVMIHCLLNPPDMAAVIGETAMADVTVWNHVFCLFPALPLLFLISGYLFFRGMGQQYDWKRDYIQKIRGRFVGLFLLYFVYCILGFLFSTVVKHEPLPSCSEFISGLWPLDPMESPMGRGMWYIRSLIIFTFLSPLYYIVIRTLKHFCLPLFFVLLNLGWPINFAYFNCCLFLGAYLAYSGITLSSIARYFDWRITLPLAVIVHIANLLWQLPCPSYVQAFLFLAGSISFFSRVKIAPILTASSTFIYVFHFFLVGALKHLFFRHLPHEMWAYILNMLMTWGAAVIICFLLFLLIRRSKYLCLILTGGRG